MQIIIKKPLVTEKSMKSAAGGMYTFLVDKKSRKPEIVKAVEESFGVNVVAIKTAIMKAEKRMQRAKRSFYEISGYKKAVVKLKDGQKIGLFELEKEGSNEQSEEEVREKKSLLKGTKVKIEKTGKKKEEKESK